MAGLGGNNFAEPIRRPRGGVDDFPAQARLFDRQYDLMRYAGYGGINGAQGFVATHHIG
ncbi:hypothetical protein BZL30_3389 [Mycobacterium kansasii]|uniref:Uncharacterized protein n=1 Tax=Mycobacterium kansasii TaxID=1768 RepID=A0A1V3XBR2_MYCKA|nr:hypothetical protein BZL30_3389 [Mycobacterium kansasii]